MRCVDKSVLSLYLVLLAVMGCASGPSQTRPDALFSGVTQLDGEYVLCDVHTPCVTPTPKIPLNVSLPPERSKRVVRKFSPVYRVLHGDLDQANLAGFIAPYRKYTPEVILTLLRSVGDERYFAQRKNFLLRFLAAQGIQAARVHLRERPGDADVGDELLLGYVVPDLSTEEETL